MRSRRSADDDDCTRTRRQHGTLLTRPATNSTHRASGGQRRRQQRGASSGTTMGQRLARQEMDSGVKLYHLQKHREAVDKWRRALRRLRSPEDRFITMGYLAQAFSESGDFREMLTYAMHQIDLANRQNDDYMKAEAYLNLARANERLSEFHKAISYGRHALQHISMDPRTPGYAHLCIANAYLGFGQLRLSLDAYERAMTVAQQCQDALLELQICAGLGQLFTQIRDLTKAVIFLKNALSLLNSVTIDDVHAKYKSLILYHLSIALRRSGSIVDAKAAVDEALRLATENGNRPIQARCLSSIADIHRELGELDKSWSRYDAAFDVMKETGDRLGQVIVLASMAKTSAERRRRDVNMCECQAIQLNKRCLDMAKSIGAKVHMLKAHGRLHRLYQELQDDESEEVASKAITSLVQELELFCNFCGQRYGLKDDGLQALRCSHIFHERCLHNHLTQRENKECPKCQHRAILDGGSMSTSAATTAAYLKSTTTGSTTAVAGCSKHRDTAAVFDDASPDEEEVEQRPCTSSSAFPPSHRHDLRQRFRSPPLREQSVEHQSDDSDMAPTDLPPATMPSSKLEDWVAAAAKQNPAARGGGSFDRQDSPGPSRLVTQLLNTAANGDNRTLITAATVHNASNQCGGRKDNAVAHLSAAQVSPPPSVVLAPLGRSNSTNIAANFLANQHGWTVTDV